MVGEECGPALGWWKQVPNATRQFLYFDNSFLFNNFPYDFFQFLLRLLQINFTQFSIVVFLGFFLLQSPLLQFLFLVS